ncbi:MAG: tetratricopeptide repeat protein [Planctomycetota bacterium]
MIRVLLRPTSRAARAALWALLAATPATAAPQAPDVGAPPTVGDTSAMDPTLVSLLDELVADVRANPESAEKRAELGLAYEGNTIWSLAQVCYEQALQLAPDETQWLFRRGVVRYYNGDVEGSIEDLRATASVFKNTPVVQARLGNALRIAGELEESEAAWRQAIAAEAKQPGEIRYPASRVGLAQVLIDLERFEEAEALCREALEIAPGYRHAHYTLGVALLNLGRDDEAAIELTKGENAYPEFPPGPHGPKLQGYGRGYSRRMMVIENLVTAGQLDEAKSRLDAILQERAEDPLVLNLAARVAMKRGEPQLAAQLIERSIAADPDEPATWLSKSIQELEQANGFAQQYFQLRGALEMGQPVDQAQVEEVRLQGSRFAAEASASAQKAVELAPAVGRHHYWRGVALQTSAAFEADRNAMGQSLQGALASFQNALKLGCTEPSFNQQLASLYEQMGRAPEMLRFSLRHLENNPTDPNALSLVVRSLLANGKQQEILPYVARLEAASVGNAQNLQFCVQAYLTVGDFDAAERALDSFEAAAAGIPQGAQFVTAVQQHIATERAKLESDAGGR